MPNEVQRQRGMTDAALAGIAILLWGLASPKCGGAQTLAHGSLGIDRFDLESGLPGMSIRDLAETEDGRLWLIASGQLASFDGLEFELHRLPPEATEPGAEIIGIGAGRGDTLWVVTGRRLVALSEDGAAVVAQHSQLLRDVWQADDGSLWGWDSDGALRFDGASVIRVLDTGANGGPFPLGPSGTGAPRDWAILHLQDPGGGKTREIARRRVDGDPASWPLPRFDDRALTTRLAGDSVEVARLDGTVIVRLARSPLPAPLLTDRRGIVWVDRGGRVEAFGVTGERIATFDVAPRGRVSAAGQDREGNLWFGTVTHGLFRVRHRPVRVLGANDGLTDRQVRRVAPGGGAGLLVLEATGRVIRWAPSRVDTLLEPSPGDRSAMAATTDRRGTQWIALRRGDRPWLQGRLGDGSEIRIPTDGFIPYHIVEDPDEDGLLWLVGGSVYRIRPYDSDPTLDGPLVDRGWGARDLWVEGGGHAWAVGPQGLAHISPEGTEEVLDEAGRPLGNGRALHRSSDGTLWIGRYAGGLVGYRDSTFREVRAEDGLWDDGVSTILEDEAGNLWMSSNRGVHRVPLDDLTAFLDGSVDRVRGRGYAQAEGFLNPETSGWRGLRGADGRLWFPTFGGLAVIDPDAVLAQELVPPRVRLRYVQAGEQRLSPDTVVRLALGARRVEVGFSATLLTGHEGIRYQVRLDGVDPDWVDLGGQRQTSYGTVPPGRHLFRARAVSGAGVSSPEAVAAIVVPAYFRETRAFGLLVLLSGSALLALAYRARIHRLRLREVELRGLVDERTRHLAESKRETEAALATVEAQSRQLRTLDEAKSRFFANVSHELRTPLTLVQGPLQDVLDGRLGPTTEPVRAQVETVLASGRRLGELVDQLLDVARLESGELRLSPRDHDLAPLLARLATAFGALAQRRGIDLVTSLPSGAVIARVDADRVEKVFANLLGNALKFTPSGGRVEWSVEAVEGDGPGSDRELLSTVSDNGPGIPRSEQDRIFERFQQVDDSPRRRHGGTGLGLALVREIVELHGGSATVRSAPGEGSGFTVRFPIGPEIDGPVDDTREPERSTPGDPASAADAHEPAPTEPDLESLDSDETRRTILVVEDNAELRGYLRRHLEDRYRVVEAANGREGLATAGELVPDLILCDVMMPEMDGETLCRAVRADPELSFLPVIMLTALASRPSRISALEGGADDYLVKPFDPRELRLRIRNLFAARQRLEARLRERGETLPFLGLDPPREPEGRDFVAQLEAVLRDRMGDEDFGIPEMGRALAMSRATLYRHVDEALGVSPMEVLWRYRLTQAAHWLRETDATVSEVAYACGFKTVPHFTRRFKKHFGTTPAAYR